MNLSFFKRILVKKNTKKTGFSFNDLSIIISTVAIVSVSAIAINSVENTRKNQLADSRKIQEIYKAIGNFALKNKRLPCASGLDKINGIDATYATEIGSGATCVAGNGVYELNVDSNIIYGAVPTKTLGLGSDYSFDQYGSKFVYIIDKRATFDVASANLVNFGNITDEVIKIKENNVIINNSLILIISYGKDKSGAFNSTSSTYNLLPTNSVSESDNLFTSLSANIANFTDTIFVKSVKGDVNFDDVIFSKNKKDFIKDFGANFLIPCIDAGDLFNNKNAFFGEVVYAKSNCPTPNDQIRPAKRCSNDGKWIYEKSCPCYIEIDGVENANVSNGTGNVKCTKSPYSGVLKYICKDNGNLEITEYCKRSCNLNAIGINVTIPSGTSKVSCNLPNFKGNYVVSCDDGVITSQIGNCSNSSCVIGGYAGMVQQTVNSGASNVNGLCDESSQYSGSYSYSCVDGVSLVTNNCYKNCNFNYVGFQSSVIKNGEYFYSCPDGYLGKGIKVVCNNGVSYVESGSCKLPNKCVVGSGIGMVSKNVNSGSSANDGTCASGYSGSYSYSCSEDGSVSIVNNCIKNNCIVGDNIAGLVSKTVNLNSSGVDGDCASGYQGFYKWSCSSTGIGSVTENNCVNSCEVGTSAQGTGMIAQFVGYDKSGDLGLCDITKGYVGNYSWSCLLNNITGKVESKVITNNCINYCQVGTLAHGVGLAQKNVAINSSGKDGQCALGYSGNYEWSCDAKGKASVISNKCINSCTVGTLDQGIGMASKTVSLNSSGSNGACDTNSGYSGSYSWSCSSLGVGKITSNNCVCLSSSDKCQKNCTVGSKSQGIGMAQKTVAVNTSGIDGKCDNANDYWGSFSWSCSSEGLGRVLQNNCKKSFCDLPVGYEGLGDTIASNTSGLLICSNGYSQSSNLYYTCTCPTEKVKFYLNSNYDSLNAELGVGLWSAPNITNNAITSINVPAGLKVTLYDDEFSGSSQIYTASSSSLTSFDNLTSSVKIECIPTFNRTGGNCNPYSCSVPSGYGYNGIASSSGGGLINCNNGYKGSISWYCMSNGTANLQGGCSINSCSVNSGVGFSGIGVVSGSGQISCNQGYIGLVNWYCNTDGNSVINNTCTLITCSADPGTGYNARTGLAYSTGSGTITCDLPTHTGTINYKCETNGAKATIIGSCTPVTCSADPGTGYNARTGLAYSTGSGTITCDLPTHTGTINYKCETNGAKATIIGSCTPVTCSADPGTGYNARTGLAYSTGSGTITCDLPTHTGTINYKCETNGAKATIIGSCTPVTCSADPGTGYNARTGLAYSTGSGTITCDLPTHTGTINYKCETNGAKATIIGSCTPVSCQVSNTTFPNLSSYNNVQATNTLAYVPCATGYYDAIRVKWESVINRNPGEAIWQHSTRIFNMMANVSYVASSDNGGPTYNIGYCGLGDPMTNQNANCHCESPCVWHNTTTENVGMCNCDNGIFALHFPSSSSSGLAYKCIAGILYGSADCKPITCLVQANIGYNSRTLNYGSGSFACDVAGYTGTINYNCNNFNTPNLSGSCTPITCLVQANTGYLARTLNYGSGSFACDAGGYTGTINYNCNAPNTPNLSGACTPSSCTIAGVNGTSTVTVNKDTVGNGACASGYTGYFSYKCDANSVGSITVNNCYTGRTFVEKTFSFNSANQVGTAYVGGWWGYEWANNYIMQTPIDYVYATKTGFDFKFNWNCSSYGSYFWPSVFKRSGTGASGTLASLGWAQFQCCGYGPHTITATPQDIVGVNVANGDVIGFYNGGYTGCNSFDSSYTVSITYMANPACAVGGSNGTVAQTVLGGSSGTNGACASGYSGSYSWTCGINGQGSITANNCTSTICNIAPGYGYNGLNNVTGAGTIACNSGFTGSISYNCTAPNTPNLSGSCTPITCAISGTGYNARTLNFGSGSFTCDAANYSGTINYNCTAPNTANLSGSCTYNGGGSYTPNWYAWTSVGCGSYITYSTNNAIEIMGPEGCGGQWTYYFTYLPSWATSVTFNWRYCTGDWNASYDPGRLYVNNTWYDVFTYGYGYGSCYYGTFNNFGVQGGTAFGPGVYSTDGCCGRAQLYFYDIVIR